MIRGGDDGGERPIFRHPLRHCAGCGEKLDSIMPVDSECEPGPGDHTACAYCGTVHRIGEDWQMVQATAGEVLELLGGPNG